MLQMRLEPRLLLLYPLLLQLLVMQLLRVAQLVLLKMPCLLHSGVKIPQQPDVAVCQKSRKRPA